MPPVTTSSTSPARIIESAICTARIDDAHTLLIVSLGVSSGRPAPIAAWRAGAWPAPPWSTWPMIAYSRLVRLDPGPLERRADRDRAELGRRVRRRGRLRACRTASAPRSRSRCARQASTLSEKLVSGVSRRANATTSAITASRSSSERQLDRASACSGAAPRRGRSARPRARRAPRRRRCACGS